MKISEIIRKLLSFDIVIPLSDRIVLMPDEDGRFTIGKGQRIGYKGRVHGSVGISYELQYEELFFEVCEDFEYDHPYSDGAGSDGGMVKYTLKPLHTGVSVIKAVYDWRGSVEKTVTHTITVR